MWDYLLSASLFVDRSVEIIIAVDNDTVDFICRFRLFCNNDNENCVKYCHNSIKVETWLFEIVTANMTFRLMIPCQGKVYNLCLNTGRNHDIGLGKSSIYELPMTY